MKKSDFVMIIKVENCNPNGDPLNDNRPRVNYDGYGEISAECIKRKIRNRLQDFGESIFVQSNDRSDDGLKSLYERAMNNSEFSEAINKKDSMEIKKVACSSWTDVRLFGQLFAFSKNSISESIRGAVSIRHCVTTTPISIKDIQIIKSVNGEPAKKGSGKSSDTMGCKCIVEHGIYVIKGSVNPFYCNKNNITDKDIENLKKALSTLFTNDESSARPSGSMEVLQVYWFTQEEENYISSAKIHNLVSIEDDGSCSLAHIDSVDIETLI